MAPRPDAASVHSCRSIASSGLRDSVQNNPPSRQSPPTNNIILRISPAAGSATFGYVYLAETEICNQDAITAYFNSAGREVSDIPCPDFESLIAANNLMYRDVLFISDLPRYIIPAGIRNLEANLNRPISQASTHHPVSALRPGGPALHLRSNPVPSYLGRNHSPGLLGRTRTASTPPHLPTTASLFRTSTWGGAFLPVAAMGGCPHLPFAGPPRS